MQLLPDVEKIEKKLMFEKENFLDYIRKSELFTASRSLFSQTFFTS